jgi:ketosteroid isomerase-like protein
MSHRWLLAAILVSACAAPSPSPGPPTMDPGRLLPSFQLQFASEAAAWNRGDLDAFMSDYAPGDLPTYVAGGHLVRGFDAIRSRYAPRFAPGARRDSLRIEELQVRPITDRYVLLTARYILFRGDSTTASGPFTLLMERRPEGWKILHDHSSSD